MERKIRLIGADLDGTLLTQDKRLTDYTRNILEKAIRAGVEVVPVTGRPLTGVPQEILEIPGIRHCITSNGANTYELEAFAGKPAARSILRKMHLPHETVRQILSAASGQGVIREIFIRGTGFHDPPTQIMLEKRFCEKPAILSYINRSRKIVPDFEALLADRSSHVENISLMFPTREERDEALGRLDRIRGENGEKLVHVLLPWVTDLEITHVLADKWLALRELGDILGIPAEEIMTVGDGDNDRPMLRGAGISAAMGNAPGFVRETADFVTEDNEHDGAAIAIAQILDL